MYFIIFLIFLKFTGITEAGELWTKYDLSASIRCITGDSNNIWMGTTGGIIRMNRNNGTETRYTQEKDGIADDNIKFIVVDNRGRVIAGSPNENHGYIFPGSPNDIQGYNDKHGGITLIDGVSLKAFKKGQGGLLGYDIAGTVLDRNNKVWIAINDHYWDVQDTVYRHKYVQAIQCLGDSLWETKIFNTQKKTMGNFPSVEEPIKCLDVANPDTIFYLFDKPNSSHFIEAIRSGDTYFQEIIFNNPIDIGDNKIGISYLKLYKYGITGSIMYIFGYKNLNTDYPVIAYYKGNWIEFPPLISGLKYSLDVQFVLDKNMITWFIAYDQVNLKYLVKYDNLNYTYYTSPQWSFLTGINCLYADDQGYIWVGTQGEGLFRFDAKNATIVQAAHQLPAQFTISSPYPNPFNAQTTISFTLTKPSKVNLSIYSLTGQKVRELAEGNYSAGKHTAVWDGKNEKGEMVSSGMYLARMESGGVSKVVRMAMVK